MLRNSKNIDQFSTSHIFFHDFCKYVISSRLAIYSKIFEILHIDRFFIFAIARLDDDSYDAFADSRFDDDCQKFFKKRNND